MYSDDDGVTRRRFLARAAAIGVLAAMPRGMFAQSAVVPARVLADDPMRPTFHLLPARNWMNDPNGPIYFDGHYHMFFQYNPLAATWGDMSWNHAVSTDMLHWKHLPVALTPTPGSADSFGVFSGSAIAVGKRVYAVYTGTQKSGSDLATIRDGANNVQESQCLAWSDDPMLMKWTKDPQPIVARPPVGLDITGFRDPSVWKQGDVYYMTVGSGIAKRGGCVLLYRSHDLKQWEYLHELTSGTWDGVKTANPCDDGEMWECPEFFALGGAANGATHVLIYSTLGKVFWESGVLDAGTMKFTSSKRGELDWGAFYAPKTQLDAQGRRILWGWIPERRSEEAMRAAGWSGMMALPRVMELDRDGVLRLTVLPQASALRAGAIAAKDGAVTLAAANGEVICTGAKGADFAVSFRDGAKEIVAVSYVAATRTMTADGHSIVLEQGDAPVVHGFVDGSVIELVLGERVGYTKRFYYTSAMAPDIVVGATGDGVVLKAWKVAAISKDRLTTPAAG